mmetsp:Transcript_40943/g.103137  ORF Transcript_40943/g.103137 Transcript_40943/m.103137 type:complete len:221 (-) Transcript_40943:43-705(-)
MLQRLGVNRRAAATTMIPRRLRPPLSMRSALPLRVMLPHGRAATLVPSLVLQLYLVQQVSSPPSVLPPPPPPPPPPVPLLPLRRRLCSLHSQQLPLWDRPRSQVHAIHSSPTFLRAIRVLPCHPSKWETLRNHQPPSLHQRIRSSSPSSPPSGLGKRPPFRMIQLRLLLPPHLPLPPPPPPPPRRRRRRPKPLRLPTNLAPKSSVQHPHLFLAFSRWLNS